MKISVKFIYTLICFHIYSTSYALHTTFTPQEPNRYEVHITFNLKQNDFMYHDYFNITSDNPHIELIEWHATTPTADHYDKNFKRTKKIYVPPVEFIALVQLQDLSVTNGHLQVTYYQYSQKKIITELITIPPLVITNEQSSPSDTKQPMQSQTKKVSKKQYNSSNSWSAYLSYLVEHTQSLWLRSFCALLLGMLLSLTPCIYPMIPITAGILHTHASNSLLYNFIRSLTYTSGLATTFALFGLTAAATGQLLGTLLTNPWFVLGMVSLLVYLALSMIGLYDLRIPSFFQFNNTSTRGGSLFTIFMCGALSGTVASPCVSPGLILLLSIVTTMQNMVSGFILLFTFGIGLSIPLLIIGTLSSSLNKLPQAGFWMVEVKQLFGFILLGMCFYFLYNIVPIFVLLGLITCTLLISGIFYLATARTTHSHTWRTIKQSLGIFLIASTVLFSFKTYESLYTQHPIDTFWITEYETARALAQQYKKPIFVDISAPYCSICTAIDKKLLHHSDVLNHLQQYIPLKIDGSDTEHSIHASLVKKFNILGVPAFLIIDPESESLSAQWGSELYDMSPEQFIALLDQHTSALT